MKRLAIWLVLLSLGLVTSGCGGNDDGAKPTPTGGATAPGNTSSGSGATGEGADEDGSGPAGTQARPSTGDEPSDADLELNLDP